MKLIYLNLIALLVSVVALTVSITVGNGINYNTKPCFEIINQSTDYRGLTSIVITDGIDTFAYDYLKPLELADLKANNFQHTLVKVNYTCPDCGETGCIYEDIDTRSGEGSDLDIESAIYEVCRERGIKDSITIDLLKANYYL